MIEQYFYDPHNLKLLISIS